MLSSDDNFGFPFAPYDIQKKFMTELYTVCESSSVGIFESPTGTGKSLSIICGGLSWLRDYEKRQASELQSQIQAITGQIDKLDDDDDWLSKAAEKQALVQSLAAVKLQLAAWEEYARRVESLKQERARIVLKQESKRELPFILSQKSSDILEEDIIEDEATSDTEEDLGGEAGGMKIFFCSRTHSQLSQFVNEVKKWAYSKEVRVVTLASRQQLCINDDVKKLGNNNLINERCIELKSKSKTTSSKSSECGVPEKKKRESSGCGCPYYRSDGISDLSKEILHEVQDIEEIVQKGRETKACPYYASRKAVKDSQLVVMPYNMLFHKQTRESCGINVKNKVVIIDEAHNILETISGIHSAETSYRQFDEAHSQVAQYLHKYNTRLAPNNLLALRQLIQILKLIITFLQKENSQVLLSSEFVVKAGIDNFNLFKILEFLESSQLCRKLNSLKTYIDPASIGKASRVSLKEFMNKEPSNGDIGSVVEERKIVGSPLLAVIPLISALCRVHSDGRIVLKKGGKNQEACVKYLLLNSSGEVKDILAEARSVVVAGGTMRPLSEFQSQLFEAAGVNRDRIRIFTFGHVISSEQVLPLIVTKGPTGKTFDFSFANRGDAKMMDELGQLIINVGNIVPGGIVVFFSSYEIENNIYKHWTQSGHLDKIAAKKKVFREPKQSSDMDSVLTAYSKCVSSSSKGSGPLTGAILLSVVGGKMSEGINFSDDLGRCVMVVGLPYPNIESPELKEKMAFLDRTQPKSPEGRSPGQQFYESLCMKAVNQSIGRAIRHQKDYASILLVDSRYERGNVKGSLPDWLANGLQVVNSFGQLILQLRKFFTRNSANV